MSENTRLLPITKEQVLGAYQEVRKHGKTAGVDNVTLDDYEINRGDHLYKVWNRMRSGSYFPPAVRRVEIPKSDGKKRKLGIPTINDRVAQTVIKGIVEPKVEPHFHKNSFGYRPARNAHQAIKQATEQSWQKAWVVDLDIESFFDNMGHERLMEVLSQHITERYVLMYIERWLKAPIEHEDGKLEYPTKGSPQGGVISPLLANVYLHHAYDQWMSKNHEGVEFERYADDIVVHCHTKEEAEQLLEAIRARMQEWGLRLHPEKTQIVHCKRTGREGNHRKVSYDFLDFRFKPKRAKNRKTGEIFTGYGPSKISGKTLKKMLGTLRTRINRQVIGGLVELSTSLMAPMRGWINYFGSIDMRILKPLMLALHRRLVWWSKHRFKRLTGGDWKAANWLKQIHRDYPNLFLHWQYGFKP